MSKKLISVHIFEFSAIFKLLDTYLSLMKENSQEKLIRTIIVSNKKDVFRIHVFEKSLKFDPRFAYGLSKNDTIYQMVLDIEKMWIEKKIELSNIFDMMIDVVGKHESYLEQFYLKPEELNFNGQLSHLISYSSVDDKKYVYFMCRKNKHKLKKITREEFEKNMKNEEVAKSYVNNYSMKNATFYNYRMSGIRDNGRNCYLMVVGDNLKVGFVKN